MRNALKRWKAVWYPNRYHGWGVKNNYFEGWYFKLVTADETKALAFIPGISMGKDGRSHSFIQLIDGTEGHTHYFDFQSEDFIPQSDRFEVKVGDSAFSENFIHINLPEINGRIDFPKISPWPKMLGAPGIMGWYSFVPFMQCYHGVVSLYHQLEGKLNYLRKEIDFTDGIGYIEKDWGSSFPKCWIWMQSNHFMDESGEVSIMASVAHIPWLGRYFVGFLVGFWYKGTLHRFTTYTGAKMKSSIRGDQVFLSFTQGKKVIKIIATKGLTGELISPIGGEMRGKVNESLSAVIDVEYYEDSGLTFSGTGRNAGLEVAGDIDILLTDK